ncbi:T9SS type A sorting domain-containing protein, partial [Flavobacteriales bacterium]|nr:T9SS type A sorting domain-containing protein [Flavobacteriales bacterium]
DASACNYIVEAIYEDGSCTYINEGDCDCDGNVEDALGVCGGTCTADIDEDGDCDDVDDCVGAYDNCGVCNGDDSSCTGCLITFACNYDSTVLINDVTLCEYDSCAGCMDIAACNYDDSATWDDGLCVNPDECGVCNGEETGPGAVYECGCADIAEGDCDCDGNVLDECGVCGGAGIAEGECDCDGNVFDECGFCGGAGIAEGECDCEGSVLDECGVCGGDNSSCLDCAGVANGDSTIDECGTCDNDPTNDCVQDCNGDWGGTAVIDDCGVCGGDGVDEDCDGICDSIDLCIATCEDPFAPCVFFGCTDPDNPGYDPIATDDDGSCLVGGCTISVACNYNPDAEYLIPGVCEFSSCVGCTDATACNFDTDATLSNNISCNYAEMYYDCDGNCLEDVIPEGGNGVCDPLDVYGCMDSDNPGYNPSATINDGSCLVAGCLIPFACNFDLEADYIDVSLCEFSSCLGCTDEEACNYNPEATISSAAQCTFPTNPLSDCDGNCINDSDGDDICDEQEIAGCTNDLAINYNEFATDDDGSCSILVGGCVIPFACNYDPAADFYVPGSCDFNFPCGGGTAGMSEAGCTNSNACNYGAEGVPCQFFDAAGNICMIGGCNHPSACNYNDDAQYNDGSCEFTSCATYGCTLSGACNFNDSATYNDGSCDYTSCYGCTNTLSENFDSNAIHNDGSCIIHGCTVSVACNYNVTATSENGSCEYSSCMNLGCTDLSACNYDSNAIVSDGSCVTATYGFDCNGNCITDLNNNNICDADDIYGCTDANALNFNNGATMNNGTCLYDTFGCTDEMACNFNHQASSDNGSCEFISCYGCMNDIACNFNVEATHPSECTYVSLYEINGAAQTIIGHDELYTYPITAGSDYIWSVIGGEIVSGLETNEVIVVWSDVSGSLTVKEISSTGCEGVDVVLNLGSVSSIFDHTVQFSVYPNPANDNIVVVSDLGLSVVTIFDATGRDVYKQQLVNRTNTIDVSNLANGTYRIVADTNEGRRMQTIVISH